MKHNESNGDIFGQNLKRYVDTWIYKSVYVETADLIPDVYSEGFVDRPYDVLLHEMWLLTIRVT